MLICHYDNVECAYNAAPGRNGSPKRQRYTKSLKHNREGSDVPDSQSAAAVCPSGITGLGS
ncbi:MAG TPA: hypothetical protein DC012_03865 [Escherichia sp.]|nr:hypothetical protein [Escherichia sp.]